MSPQLQTQEFDVASTIATLTENEPSRIFSREGDDWPPDKAHNLFVPHVLTDTQQQQSDEMLDSFTVGRKKSQFRMKRPRFLGMIISEQGIQVDNTKVEAVMSTKRPDTVKHMRSFSSMTVFFHRFTEGYAEWAAPLSEMTKGKSTGLVWSDNAVQVFASLKVVIAQAPIFANQQYDKPFVIECDNSDWYAGSVLMQYIDNTPYVIEYYSAKTNQAQQQYRTTEKKCLSVILGIEKCRPYIDTTHFTAVTDHASLKWLTNVRDPTGRLSRWALRLQCYDFGIVHRPEKQHHVPDARLLPVDLIDAIAFITTTDEWYSNRGKSGHNTSRQIQGD